MRLSAFDYLGKVFWEYDIDKIRNTSILYGKDAKRFLAEIEKLLSEEERRKERACIDANVECLKRMILTIKSK